MKKYIVILVICIAMIMQFNVANVHAMTKKSETNQYSFKTSWEVTTDYYTSINSQITCIGTMVYGYNTDFIKEDYCWTTSSKCKYQSMIENGNGNFSSSTKSAGSSWAKLEKQHSGSSVKYAIWLSKTYTCVTQTTNDSNVK